MFDEQNLFAPQGWQCPVCKRVYSPSTSMCLYCNRSSEITYGTTSTDVLSIEEIHEMIDTVEAFKGSHDKS